MVETDTATGEILQVFEGPNLIVDAGRTTLGQLLTQATEDPADKVLEYIRFAEGTTPAAASDTAMSGALMSEEAISAYTEDVSSVPGLIEIEAAISGATGSGQTLGEIGAVCSDGTLFARQLTPSIVKTGGNTITVNWRFQFSLG